MPDALPAGTWESAQDGAFVADAALEIAEAGEAAPPPKALQLKPGARHADKGGRYELVEGLVANGFPVFKRLTSEHYLHPVAALLIPIDPYRYICT